MPADEILLPGATMAPAQVAAQVAAIIRAHPDRHDQHAWWDAPGDPSGITAEALLGSLDQPGCGTTCCVAGWAVAVGAPAGSVIEGWRLPRVRMPDGTSVRLLTLAAALLGIECDDSDERFFPALFESDASREFVLAELDRIAAGTR